MPTTIAVDELLDQLNPPQRQAAGHGEGPLLIIAGAGTGKTTTLAHRVAVLIARGIDPSRILLLTFTRRAAAEMIRRADALLERLAAAGADGPHKRRAGIGAKVWGGTFHAIATRLLRVHGKSIGLAPDFTIHDRGDSQDLIGVLRSELNLARTDKRFPQKGTCLDIYSRAVNARQPIDRVLAESFPWCRDHGDDLQRLFAAYVDRKEQQAVLDYDDLLLFWHGLLADSSAGDAIRRRFDCVLVDEYQDTNALQAEIVAMLRPDGHGLSVVGDDAQSIYAFRAASVRNILDFPQQFPGTTQITLEQNYRSTQPILAVTNAVIAEASEGFRKELWSSKKSGPRPALVHCEDEVEQAEFLVRRILEHREEDIDLKRQAVLFRASHHSLALELELRRADIPFHKYGGLKFVEAAHVKDLTAFLRLAENPTDLVSGLRVIVLLPGVGPKRGRQLLDQLHAAGGDFSAWQSVRPPAAAAEIWPQFVGLLLGLSGKKSGELPTQVDRVRQFYEPILSERYDHASARLRDLEQLTILAARFRTRAEMLTELTLDPPSSTQDLAGPPHLDDDYLVLSTMHSAKGLEWDAVYVIHAADGNIPSDMATSRPEEIEEERRLFYVALSRARSWLYVCAPRRYYSRPAGASDRHTYAQLSRFITPAVRGLLEEQASDREPRDDEAAALATTLTSADIRRQIRSILG